ncbi:MAG: hypothetical protein GF364_10370 [Candidatus Lokiarchaeota archaeon]|nr:hypothetical protein [Candidatus Lokiarchaeota archaeon]
MKKKLTIKLLNIIELSILFGIHFFWIIYKWDLFPIEKTSDLLALCSPFLLAYLVGICCRIEKYKKYLFEIEWIFHSLVSLGFLVLLAYLQFRNEFSFVLPFSWGFYLWTGVVALLLSANIITHSRLSEEKATVSPENEENQDKTNSQNTKISMKRLTDTLINPRKLIYLGIWVIILFMLSILSYPIYFAFFSISFHSILMYETKNVRDKKKLMKNFELNELRKVEDQGSKHPNYSSILNLIKRKPIDNSKIYLDKYTKIISRHLRTLFLVIIFAFSWGLWALNVMQMGSLEDKWGLFIRPFINPLFYLGVASVGFSLVSNIICKNKNNRITRFLDHRLITDAIMIIIFSLVIFDIYFIAPVIMGYSIISLIQTMLSQNSTSYASTLIATTIGWTAGLYLFTFNGMLLNLVDTIFYILKIDIDATIHLVNLLFVLLLSAILMLKVAFSLFDILINKREKIKGTNLSGEPRNRKNIVQKVNKNSKSRKTEIKNKTQFFGIFGLVFLSSLVGPFLVLNFPLSNKSLGFPPSENVELSEFSGIALSPNYALDLVNESNGSWTRIHITWRNVESEEGLYDFSYYDEYIDNASYYGVKIVAMLSHRPHWVDIPGNHYITEAFLPQWLDFVNATVRRYRYYIKTWEIWNEPNLERFWDGPMEDFYHLANETAKLIHNIDNSIYIISPSFSAASAGYVPPHLAEMFNANIMQFIDAISIHFYNFDPDTLYAGLLQYINVGKKYGFTGDYLVTEIGNPTSGGYPHMVTEKSLADNVIKCMVISSVYQIRTFLWYCVRDSGNADDDKWNSEKWFGLYYNNLTRKMGANAFDLFSEFCANSKLIPDMLRKNSGFASKDLMTMLYQNTGSLSDTYTLIMWYAPTLYEGGKVNVNIDFNNAIHNVTLHDIYTKSNVSMVESSVDVGNSPIVITFNCSDLASPLILTISNLFISEIIYFGICGIFLIAIVFMHHKKLKEIRNEKNARKENKTL